MNDTSTKPPWTERGVSRVGATVTITLSPVLVSQLLMWGVTLAAFLVLAADGTLVRELLKALAVTAVLKLHHDTAQ